MTRILLYKGHIGSVNFSDEDKIYWGELLGIGDSVSYDGKNIKALTHDFHAAVDCYLDYCKEKHETPEIPNQEKLKIKTIRYKEFEGSVNFSEEDNIFWGEVLGIDDSISYEGRHIGELIQDFCNAIDFHLYLCKKRHIVPKVSYDYDIVLSQEVQRAATLYGLEHGMTLDEVVEYFLRQEIEAGKNK